MKKFINIWEEDNQVVLVTKEGIEMIPYRWYFCIKKEDATAHKEALVDMLDSKQIEGFVDDGTGWIRIYVKYDYSMKYHERIVAYLKSLKIETFEGDLKLWMRYLVDEEIELETDMRVLYFDIETYDLKKGISPGEEQVISIAAMNSAGEEFYFSDLKNEKKVLRWFIKLLAQHDLLVGWNSEGFDLPAISKRCELLSIEFDCWISTWSAKDMGGLDNVRKTGKLRARPTRFNHMDLMMKIKEMHYRDTELIKKVRSFSLSAVSKAILGKDKLDRSGQTMYELANQNPEKLEAYNRQDARLLYELDNKLGVTKQKLIEHWICGARVNDYTSHGKIDPFALRAARRMGMRLPTRPDKEEIEEAYDDVSDAAVVDPGDGAIKRKGDYAGGFVFDPERGLHQNVHAFDFQSLYPSIIKTFNISIDSFTNEQYPVDKGIPQVKHPNRIILPTGWAFDRERKGIIPRIIQDLLDKRDEIRNVEMKKVVKNSEEYMNLHYKQYAFKVLANSMYGIMGANFSRYYRRELAEGITLAGQHLIKLVWGWIIEKGHHPIYGDSDSIFVIFNYEDDPKKLAQEISMRLVPYVQEKFNVAESHLSLNYEATYLRFILAAKKKYVGVTESGEWKMMGLEAKKRDTLPLAEKWQREILNFMLLENHGLDFFVSWAQKNKEHVYSGQLKKEEITYQKRLSREIEDYYGREIKDKKTGRGKIKKDGTIQKVPVPVYVRVAEVIRDKHGESDDKANKYSTGSYIPYIITASKKNLEAIYAEDFNGEYDREHYWDACYGPTLRVLEVVFPGFDWEYLGEPRPKRNAKRKKIPDEE